MRRTCEGIGGMTVDREKKIAEIREGYKSERDDNFTYKKEIVEQDIRFLLSELDRAEKELELFDQRGETIERQLNIIEQLQEENRKLLEERDEARSKAEEAWKEIDSLEEQLLSSQQEIERLRQLYEREREIADQALEQVKNLREERNQDRQWIEKASENVTKLQQERDKMIEWLRTCLFNHGCWREEDYVAYIRDLLKEIGVTVE
jgi:chromosome segregation ATPase